MSALRAMPRAALVTGAGRRIGRSIALALARDGWAVGVHYQSSGTAARATVAEIEAAGGRAVALGADLADEAATDGLIGRTVEALGPLGCLVNNASTFDYDTVATATRQSWDLHMEVNLRAPFLLTRHFAEALPADAEGAVINLLDQRVWNLTPHFITYTLSKSALWTLTRTLAMALAPRIRVNGIGPGPTLPSVHQTQEQFDRQCASLPLQHAAGPDEIADAVRYVLGAGAMTGQMIALDGGQHLGWAQPGAPDAAD